MRSIARLTGRFDRALIGMCGVLTNLGVSAFYCDAARRACPVPPPPTPPPPEAECPCWDTLELGARNVAVAAIFGSEFEPTTCNAVPIDPAGTFRIASDPEGFTLITDFATHATCTSPSVSMCAQYEPFSHARAYCEGSLGFDTGGGTIEISIEEAESCFEIMEWAFGPCNGGSTTEPPPGARGPQPAGP